MKMVAEVLEVGLHQLDQTGTVVDRRPLGGPHDERGS